MDDDDMVAVAERLVDEFADLVPREAVVQALRSCLAEFSSCGPYFVEQAVRAQLQSAVAAQAR